MSNAVSPYDEEQSSPEEGYALREVQFTDLYISERGEAFLRGVDDAPGPICEVPDWALADVDALHRQVCSTGQFKDEFFLDYDRMRFRVSKIEEADGNWYTLRRAMYPIPRFTTLDGIPPKVVQYLAQIGLPGKHGLLVIAGATGQGKTTTACSLLQEYLMAYGDVAVTVEDPIELPMSGVYQPSGHCFQTEVKNGDFAAAMKLTMRRTPRYILLGEVRGGAEASQAIRAAANGHLVLTTIHAGDPISALNAMVKFVAGSEDIDLARHMLADGLLGVLHQELIKVPGRKKQLKLNYLFTGDDSSVKNLIREGKLHMLTTAMAQQQSRVMLGKLPVDSK